MANKSDDSFAESEILNIGFEKSKLNNDFINILKQTYFKVLCVNLKTKKHKDLFLKNKSEEEKAYSEDISKWFTDFADNSFVHKEDIEYYKQNTNVEFLYNYFEKYDEPYKIMYRRRQKDEYKWAEMVIMKSEGYTKENPIVVLSVMDAEKYSAQNAKENQGIFDCFNIAAKKDDRNIVAKLLKYIASFYNADDAFVCDNSNIIVYEYQDFHYGTIEDKFCMGSAVDENLELIIVNPKDRRDYHLLYRCAALIIYRILLDRKIEEKYIIEKRQSRIINALSKRFFTIYRVDLVSEESYKVYAPEYVENLLKGYKGVSIILDRVEAYLVDEDYRSRMHEFNDYTKWSERLQGKDNVSMEFKGTNRWARAVVIAAQRDDDGNVTEVLYAVQDIEEQKIREAEQDYKLREALKKANAASEAKSIFLSNMSHDIRTPMNAIVGFSNLAKQNIDDTEMVKEYLEEITVAGRHLVSLINEVLDMSHIESGKTEINVTSSDITEIIGNICHVMKMDIESRNISLNIDMSGISHKKVLCDETKINQIMFNIIGNAVKYNKDNGTIDVICKETSREAEDTGMYEITVRDTGIGMSGEFLGKIFDTFERESDTITTGVQGTGLGMPITKGLIELMDGEIQVESEKMVGTTCIIRIPLIIDTDNDQDNKDVETENEANIERLKEIKMLLVDDNIVNQKLAEALFKNLGLSLDIVSGGKEAIDALEEKEEGHYGVIFMDMQMPVMDGLQTTDAIRKHSNKAIAKIPIIMMTANVFEEDKKKSFDVGANGYIAKPIDVDILISETCRVIKEND